VKAVTRKNPAAVSLGRLGGKAGTPAQDAARRLNARKGGRKPRSGERATRRLVIGLTESEWLAIEAHLDSYARKIEPVSTVAWARHLIKSACGID
jgi:hypothetical protein